MIDMGFQTFCLRAHNFQITEYVLTLSATNWIYIHRIRTQQPFNIVWLVCCYGAVQWNLFNYYLLPPIHHPIDTWAKHVLYSHMHSILYFPPKQLLHLLKSHKYLICRYDLNKSASYSDTYTMFGCHQIQFTAYLTKSKFKTPQQQKS